MPQSKGPASSRCSTSARARSAASSPRLQPARAESQLLRGRTHKVQGDRHRPPEIARREIGRRHRSRSRRAGDPACRRRGRAHGRPDRRLRCIVNLTAGRLKSETYSATINLGGHEVDASRHQARARRRRQAGAEGRARGRPFAAGVGFSLDAERGVRDPRGMVGDTLGVDMHVLTGDAAPLRNLELCINRSHLSVERMVATPYASGLAALVDDELEMGAACIDMGGGTTTISVFADGKFVHARRAAGRRQPRHDGYGQGPVDPARRCRAAEGHARLGVARQRRRPRDRYRAADGRRRWRGAAAGAALGDDPHHPRPRRGDAGDHPRPAQQVGLRQRRSASAWC